MAVAQGVYGPDSAGDPFRGLYINADEVERLLAQPPGAPTLAGDPFAPEDDDPAEESAAFRGCAKPTTSACSTSIWS